jgi:uncharacterized protein (DUF2249 family)
VSDGDAACWLHLVCDECGGVVAAGTGHRSGCSRALVGELDVPALPRGEKHPTIFRLLDRLAVGESVRIRNDHDPIPLRLALEKAAGAFAFEYLERGPECWRVEIRRIGAGSAPREGIERGPILLSDADS